MEGKTLAEMSKEEKDKISCRRKALIRLHAFLLERVEGRGEAVSK
jgi:inosine/xanthosine triphosphate pyrophosphatase family protein